MSFDARPSVRRRMLAPLVVAVAMVGALFALSTPGTAVTDDEAGLASLVNGARAAAGLPPLALSGALSDAARSHSASMASSGTLVHSGGLAGSVITDWTRTGENVGVGSSVGEIHAALMGSSSHRANILGDFNVLGVGVVRGSDGRLWATELFVKTASVVTEPAPVVEPVVTTTVPVLTTAAPVDATVVAPAVVEPAKAKPQPRRPAKVRAAKAPAPRRPAPAAKAKAKAATPQGEGDCLPPQAQGQGHAYGRCDEVPQGQGGGRP